MGIGISILLIAAGAVLTWAVDYHVSGVSIHLVGIILMVVGAIGLLAALIIGGSQRPAARQY
jgi:hypothetical protein